MTQKLLSLAIDGNEANITNRVGSNVYAFEMIKAIYQLVKRDPTFSVTVLLRMSPLEDMPPAFERWQYLVIKPNRCWVYWSLSQYLHHNHNKYQVFYTPGHYVPLVCPIPLISSVMDLGFLAYPRSFKLKDWLQLTLGTKWATHLANQLVAISQFTKQEISHYYHYPKERILVAPPANTKKIKLSPSRQSQISAKLGLKKPFFLYLGTIQPRKNLLNLIKAYELFATDYLKKTNSDQKTLPQLVLAGKVGWLAQEIIKNIERSKFKTEIIRLGFVSETEKATLYSKALASILVSPYEGFGIPPLESMVYNCLPIVANSSSLPEVVGEAGIKLDPNSTQELAEALKQVRNLTQAQLKQYRHMAKQQLEKYTWSNSAQLVLKTASALTRS